MIKIFQMQGGNDFLGEYQPFFGEEWLENEAIFQGFAPHFQTVGDNHGYTIRNDPTPCCLKIEESDVAHCIPIFEQGETDEKIFLVATCQELTDVIYCGVDPKFTIGVYTPSIRANTILCQETSESGGFLALPLRPQSLATLRRRGKVDKSVVNFLTVEDADAYGVAEKVEKFLFFSWDNNVELVSAVDYPKKIQKFRHEALMAKFEAAMAPYQIAHDSSWIKVMGDLLSVRYYLPGEDKPRRDRFQIDETDLEPFAAKLPQYEELYLAYRGRQ